MAQKVAKARTHTIAALYELWSLDAIPNLGPVCARLYEAEPRQFKSVSGTTSAVLANLHYLTGHSVDHLDRMQRGMVTEPLLGSSDGTGRMDSSSEFGKAAAAVRQAAADYAQRVYDSGEEQLRQAFIDSCVTLRAYLNGVSGSVADYAYARLVAPFDAVVAVLQDGAFSAGFGLPPAPTGGTWPLALEVSADGSNLVREISLQSRTVAGAQVDQLGDDQFLRIQRIAHFGAAVIDAVADPAVDVSTVSKATATGAKGVLSLAYRWWTAIREQSLGSTVA